MTIPPGVLYRSRGTVDQAPNHPSTAEDQQRTASTAWCLGRRDASVAAAQQHSTAHCLRAVTHAAVVPQKRIPPQTARSRAATSGARHSSAIGRGRRGNTYLLRFLLSARFIRPREWQGRAQQDTVCRGNFHLRPLEPLRGVVFHFVLYLHYT